MCHDDDDWIDNGYKTRIWFASMGNEKMLVVVVVVLETYSYDGHLNMFEKLPIILLLSPFLFSRTIVRSIQFFYQVCFSSKNKNTFQNICI